MSWEVIRRRIGRWNRRAAGTVPGVNEGGQLGPVSTAVMGCGLCVGPADCRAANRCLVEGRPLIAYQGGFPVVPTAVQIPTHMKPEEIAGLVDLVRRLRRELARKVYALEVGTWLGRSAVEMAAVDPEVQVWAVDWHRSDDHLAASVGGAFDSARPFLDNLDRAGVRDRVTVLIGRSEEVLPRLRADSFDLAFLDGFHSAEQTATDAQACIDLLRCGSGVLAAHDYGLFGVAEGLASIGLPRPASRHGSLAVFYL